MSKKEKPVEIVTAKKVEYDGPFGKFSIPFKQARHFTPVSDNRGPRVIVIHSMEAPEKGDMAERVANYFSSMSDGRVASAHYCVDNNSIVQCVQCKDVAYGAKGMNRHGIHIELTGYARQTRSDWEDEFSSKMLKMAAFLCGKILVPKYGIALRWLTDDEIRRVASDKSITGFVTHAMVTRALGIRGGHTDPGNGFPLNDFLAEVGRFSR